MEIKYSAVCAIVLFIFKHFNCADGHQHVCIRDFLYSSIGNF